jgi:RNA polymerase subunit RPABC4/transcription elongation factor Spt4
MAVQHARVCGACERECPSWANRCPACGSTAISYQLIVAPPDGTRIRKIADNAPRLRRSRARVATALDSGVTLHKSPTTGCVG